MKSKKLKVLSLLSISAMLFACGNSSSSEKPATSTESATSVAPSTSETPATSEAPATSEKPATSEAPVTSETPAPSYDTVHAGTEADPFSVADAIKVAQTVGTTATSEKFYIKGYVVGVDTSSLSSYGNINVDIVDEGSKEKFTAYQISNIGGVKFTAGQENTVELGDTIVVLGNIVNYNDKTPETTGKGAASLVSVVKGTKPTDPKFETVHAGTETDPYTIADAIKVAQTVGEIATIEQYYISGIINKINTSGVSSYGNVNIDMADTLDATDKFVAFQIFNIGGVKFTAETAADYKVGDKVVILGNIVNYQGKTPETTGKGAAKVVKHEKGEPIAVTGITVVETLQVEVGKAKALNASVEPSYADNKELTYVSDTESVATVDATGKVTGVAVGTAKITVTSVGNPAITKEVTVTVVEASPTPVEEQTVKYNFASDTVTAGTKLTSATLVEFFNTSCEGTTIVVSADNVSNTYHANPTQGPKIHGLKFSTSSSAGSFDLVTSESITKITAKISSWKDGETDTLTINDVANTTNAMAGVEVTYDLSANPTKALHFAATNRVTITELTFHF